MRALRAQGSDGRLIVVGEEKHAPYDRPPFVEGVSEWISASEVDISLTEPEDADREVYRELQLELKYQPHERAVDSSSLRVWLARVSEERVAHQPRLVLPRADGTS